MNEQKVLNSYIGLEPRYNCQFRRPCVFFRTMSELVQAYVSLIHSCYLVPPFLHALQF